MKISNRFEIFKHFPTFSSSLLLIVSLSFHSAGSVIAEFEMTFNGSLTPDQTTDAVFVVYDQVNSEEGFDPLYNVTKLEVIINGKNDPVEGEIENPRIRKVTKTKMISDPGAGKGLRLIQGALFL